MLPNDDPRLKTAKPPAAHDSSSTPGSASADKRVAASPGPPERQASPRIDRRSQRVHIEMPVLLYGNHGGNEPFQEEAHTVTVNAHGGLLLMTTRVVQEGKLILTNPKTRQDVECRVAYVGLTENGKTQIGVEFSQPSPRFWGIAFPPADWDPAERKRPSALKPR